MSQPPYPQGPGEQPYQQPNSQMPPYQQPSYGQPHSQMQPYGQPHSQMQPYGQPHYQVQPYPPQRPAPTAPPKSPGVAVILQFLFCGLGHMYTGNPLWAVGWFLTAVVVGLLTAGIGLLIVWPLAMTHAYISASNFNTRHHVVR